MIDRTALDLRIAEHSTMTARINGQEWQRQGRIARPTLRAGLAALMIALAARLEPGTLPARQDGAMLPSPTRA